MFTEFVNVPVAVGVAVSVEVAVSVGVGDSVSAADVAERKEAAAVCVASTKTVSMNGVAGVADGVMEGVSVTEGVNAKIVAVAALGVYVPVAVEVAVGSVPVMVTVTDGVFVGGIVAVGGTGVNVG